jgi:hypothetical protein
MQCRPSNSQQRAGSAPARPITDHARTHVRGGWWKAASHARRGRPQQLSVLLTTCWLLLLVA